MADRRGRRVSRARGRLCTHWPGGLRRWRVPLWVALAAAATSLVLLASGSHALIRQAGPVAGLAEQRSVVVATGLVASEPVVRSGRTGQNAVLRGADRGVGQGPRVEGAHPRPGPRRRGVGRAALARADRGARATRAGAARRRGGRRPAAAVEPARDGARGRRREGAEHLRAGLREAAAPLPADARGLLPALVIGDTSRTPDDLTEAMLATGMTHLSAVSGSNVAIVLAVALAAAAVLAGPPVAALLRAARADRLRRPRPPRAQRHPRRDDGSHRPVGAQPVPARGGHPGALCRGPRPAGARPVAEPLLRLRALHPRHAGPAAVRAQLGEAIGARLPRRLRSWGPALAIPVAAQAMCAPVVVLLRGR